LTDDHVTSGLAFLKKHLTGLQSDNIRIWPPSLNEASCCRGSAKAKAEGKYRGGIPTARAKAAQVFALVDAGSHREMSRLLPNRSLIRQMTNIMLAFQVQHN